MRKTSERGKIRNTEIDFAAIYAWFDGTIWPELDCGHELCSDARCCGGVSEAEFIPSIYFLPGEFHFLSKALGHRLPFIEKGDGLFHCFGSKHCVYDMRPIDCRSFPLWPIVHESKFLGFADCRGNRCPIALIPPSFILHLGSNWKRLFSSYPFLLRWIEQAHHKHQINYTIEELGDAKERS